MAVRGDVGDGNSCVEMVVKGMAARGMAVWGTVRRAWL
jgi:hypothetical protein